MLIFQLKKDLPKIVKKTGSYASKVKKFNLDEKRDLKKYAKLNTKIDKKTGEVLPTRVHGADGNMSVIARRTEDISWRATSKPHGIIAEKRVRYLFNIYIYIVLLELYLLLLVCLGLSVVSRISAEHS